MLETIGHWYNSLPWRVQLLGLANMVWLSWRFGRMADASTGNGDLDA